MNINLLKHFRGSKQPGKISKREGLLQIADVIAETIDEAKEYSSDVLQMTDPQVSNLITQIKSLVYDQSRKN
jgi:hypothetical protein